jgi:hypothetical protein
MLAGRPPFLPDDNQTALTVRVLTEEPVSPAWHRPGIPRDLETICLKCLEKEPRERYADAGALAEDLRRFLNDESILAKPPGRVVKGVKWVRRHPWKFIAAAAVTVLLIAGIARLAQWELYQRPHIEYSATVVWVNGGLEPIEKISADAAAHRAGYLRLTRQGRFGPIVKVEALNARGNPAVLRRILSDELIPLYLEGLAGAQVYSETRPETTTVEFEYAGRTAAEATGRDRNGQVNWRLLYDHPDPRTHTVQARFVNLQGFDSTSREGASHLEFERDPQGRDHRVTFFNGVGQPAANGEGVYGYELDHDRPGHITNLVNLGADGAPAANRTGLIGYAATWGKDVRYDVRDGAGQPATWNGIAAIVSELDSAGNLVRSTSLGADGKPESSSATAYSVQDLKRNDHGELVQRIYSKAQPDGSLKEVKRTDISYDEFGHPADLRDTATGAAGPSRTAWNNDRNGNITEERSLDASGQPITGEQGYAIRRFSYASGPQGLTVEETYFDANGGKVYCKSGYHRTITEFNASGTLRRQIFDEHDPAQYPYYRRSSVPEFDAQGQLHRLTIRYEDGRGELTTSAEIPYVVSDNTYDEQGHVVTEWLTARDPQAFGGALIRTDTEWYPGGGMKRRVRQVYDANRQPAPVIPTGSPARKEEEFDSTGDPERIYETGFDEQVVGFGSREARVAAGALSSVVHKRNDGTTLDSVRVLISGVVPPADQPRSAELHAGDQLVAANGKPVTSAYAWVFGGPFPGGWIEVLRNGRRIRIDGFKPGKLGIYLDERGPLSVPPAVAGGSP